MDLFRVRINHFQEEEEEEKKNVLLFTSNHLVLHQGKSLKHQSEKVYLNSHKSKRYNKGGWPFPGTAHFKVTYLTLILKYHMQIWFFFHFFLMMWNAKISQSDNQSGKVSTGFLSWVLYFITLLLSTADDRWKFSTLKKIVLIFYFSLWYMELAQIMHLKKWKHAYYWFSGSWDIPMGF